MTELPDVDKAVEKIASERWVCQENIFGGIVAAFCYGKSVEEYVANEVVDEIEGLRIDLAEARAMANEYYVQICLPSEMGNLPYPDLLGP